ncbi:IQ and ubiquitin-like domain-containing protein [Daktulosphaira vitifoliae]|uniref:IQ and ubiquitin-like domain-containing protein n=1 Tax=Daktulosphaira vitifoliae TaxID=58002 RepID=UPI0021A98D95|nr:IQ and ubiquitin-like domain-containing protein [Daktulosphaira vitifoliae]
MEKYGKDKTDEIVTVKIFTQSNQTLTYAFSLSTSVDSLKSYLHQVLNVDKSKIILKHKDEVLEDDQSLKQLGATSLGTFELYLQAEGIKLTKCSFYLPVVDVITVKVKGKTIIVEIENCTRVKPWLGGYRDLSSGKVYHNANAQTDFKPKIYANIVQADRPCQTAIDKAINHVMMDTGVQTGNASDGIRCVSPKAYQRDSMWLHEEKVVQNVIIIQRAFRRVLKHRKRVQAEQKQRPATIKSSVSQLELKQQHYNTLYAMISKWLKKERRSIKDIAADKSTRKTAQMNLLKKEIKFLMEVEKQRLELKYELTKHDDITFLNKTSKPKIFKNKNGKLLTVDTVGNQKARELKDIYLKITSQLLLSKADNRLHSLDDLYNLVCGSKYKYKRDFMDVIEMEKDLIKIQAEAVSLKSIRSRIEQLFRHFIRQPEVNPEVDSYYRPTEKRILNVYTCIRCKRNLAATDFSLESRVNRTNVCANCEWAEKVGHKHIDMAPYRKILKTLRHDELQMAAYHSECFIMQPTEIYRLVTIIWEEKSAISETSQLNVLKLVRWRKEQHWSPWNCVLLTRDEAKVHLEIEDSLEDYYDVKFISWVNNKHFTAKLQFANLVQVVKNRSKKKSIGLTKNWQVVADNFSIRI